MRSDITLLEFAKWKRFNLCRPVRCGLETSLQVFFFPLPCVCTVFLILSARGTMYIKWNLTSPDSHVFLFSEPRLHRAWPQTMHDICRVTDGSKSARWYKNLFVAHRSDLEWYMIHTCTGSQVVSPHLRKAISMNEEAGFYMCSPRGYLLGCSWKSLCALM